MQLLIEAGADVHKADTNGFTSLIFAALGGHQQAVQLLIEAGADVDKADTNGSTPVRFAIYGGHHQTVQLLIDGDADVDKADTEENTALIDAADSGQFATVQLLIQAGADANHVPSQHLLTVMEAEPNNFGDGTHLLLTTPAAQPGVNWLVHLATHNNQEPLAETVQRSLVWSPDSHSLFPLAFRKGVKQVCRLKAALDHKHFTCAFSQMDNDLWHMVIGRV